MNIWKATGDTFGLDGAEAEKKYKNVGTAYGQYLRKKKGLFHLALGVMLSSLQQSSVIWIGCQTTSTNDHSLLQTSRVAMTAKMMQIMVKKQNAQTMSREYGKLLILLASDITVEPKTCVFVGFFDLFYGAKSKE